MCVLTQFFTPDELRWQYLRKSTKRIVEADSSVNPWAHRSKISRSEQQPFRKAVISYYERASSDQFAKCMLLDKSLHNVIAGHIWMRAANRDDVTVLFDLPPEAVNSPRNGLLLYKPIEQMFDELRVCFYWDFMAERIKFHVLDKNLLGEIVLGDTTYGDLEGRPLCHPPGKMPYRRILSFHALRAFEKYPGENNADLNLFRQFRDLSPGAPRTDELSALLSEIDEEEAKEDN